MFCTQCGKENNDDAKFCAKCGAEIVSERGHNNESVAESQEQKVKTESVAEVSSIDTEKLKKNISNTGKSIFAVGLVTFFGSIFFYQYPEATGYSGVEPNIVWTSLLLGIGILYGFLGLQIWKRIGTNTKMYLQIVLVSSTLGLIYGIYSAAVWGVVGVNFFVLLLLIFLTLSSLNKLSKLKTSKTETKIKTQTTDDDQNNIERSEDMQFGSVLNGSGLVIVIVLCIGVTLAAISMVNMSGDSSLEIYTPSEIDYSTDVLNPETNAQKGVTTAKVGQFYDGKDRYSVSIPTGNRSTCVWNWVGGNASIPDGTTTYAETSTQKHTIVYYPGSTFQHKVNCFDDFGNQYAGVFPTANTAEIVQKEDANQAQCEAAGQDYLTNELGKLNSSWVIYYTNSYYNESLNTCLFRFNVRHEDSWFSMNIHDLNQPQGPHGDFKQMYIYSELNGKASNCEATEYLPRDQACVPTKAAFDSIEKELFSN